MKISDIKFYFLLLLTLFSHTSSNFSHEKILTDSSPTLKIEILPKINSFAQKTNLFHTIMSHQKDDKNSNFDVENNRITMQSRNLAKKQEINENIFQKRMERNLKDDSENEILSLESDMSEINEFFGNSNPINK